MKFLLAAFAVVLGAQTAIAAVTTYTDRTAFETALSSFNVDDYTGVTPFSHTSADRGDYTIASPGMYGCVNNPGSCGPAPAGGDGIGLFHYLGADTFTFDTAINGFGFDFGQTVSGFTTRPIIDGNTATTLGGFWGIITDDAKTVFTLNQSAQYLITDNLTYGVVSAVPLPAGMALFGGAFGLMALFGRRKAALLKPTT